MERALRSPHAVVVGAHAHGGVARSAVPACAPLLFTVDFELWRHAFEPAETDILAHVSERSAGLTHLTACLAATDSPLRANTSPPLALRPRATASLGSILELAFLARFAAPGEGVDATQTGQ
jgi:hypothetical protein